jgi:hypothetical protein
LDLEGLPVEECDAECVEREAAALLALASVFALDFGFDVFGPAVVGLAALLPLAVESELCACKAGVAMQTKPNARAQHAPNHLRSFQRCLSFSSKIPNLGTLAAPLKTIALQNRPQK